MREYHGSRSIYEFIQGTNKQIDITSIKLGIVCPMANEEGTAERFVKDILMQCQSFNFRSISLYIIFDRTCNDNTMELLHKAFSRTPEVKIIYSPANKNVVDAYLRGYREALAEKNDWILEIDAGFSHQPEDIPLFVKTMQLGYDCVFGSRFMPGGFYDCKNCYRHILSKWGTFIVNFLIGTRLTDMTSGFEIFTHQALTDILGMGLRSTGPFFQTEIKTYAHRYSITEVPIKYTNGSHAIGVMTLFDSGICLWGLFIKRLLRRL